MSARCLNSNGPQVDVGFVGTCTNGRLEDIAAAAAVVDGKRLRKRLLVVPASSMVLRDASTAGYISTLVDAGRYHRHAWMRTLHGKSHGSAGSR